MKRTVRLIGATLAVATLVASAGCVRIQLPVSESASDTDRIELGDAESVMAIIEMGAGKLAVTGGTDALMDAEFRFTDSAWRPQVDYEVRNAEGRLSVRMPSRPRLNLTGNMRYEWTIALTDRLPLDLAVTMGAGEARLDLGALDLRSLQMNLGAGDATIDLVGDATNDLTADITAGAGALTLRVPSDVGVRVLGHRDGLGTYSADGFIQDGDALVNPAWENADVRFEITLRRGVGDVTIELVD